MINIISFTTIPTRVKDIKPMVDSILNQDMQPDKIILWVSEHYQRFKDKIEIPKFILDSKIEVRYVTDLGPINKLFYSLVEYWDDKDTNIVTCDDDVIYPKEWFSNLINASKKIPNSAIGNRGAIFEDKLKYSSRVDCFGDFKCPFLVHTITGIYGALYKPSFFTEDFFNIDEIIKNFTVDDLWISGNLAKNGINRVVIPSFNIQIDVNLCDVESLWDINRNSQNNNKMLKYFEGII